MAFKDDLLKKIRIDQLAARVLASIGPEGSEGRIDKDAMRELLSFSSFAQHRERDLDLYVQDTGEPPPKILVLDAELPIYHTTAADVAMRKSPEVGEMVRIGNIIKILRDSDVKISRKADSLQAVQSDCIARLNLSFSAEDINEIRRDGIASLESNYAEGVKESLMLFAELLGFRTPAKPFQAPHCAIYAAIQQNAGGAELLGPVVIFSLVHNSLQLAEGPFDRRQPEDLERFQALAAGKGKPTAEGRAVFERLQQEVLNSRVKGD